MNTTTQISTVTPTPWNVDVNESYGIKYGRLATIFLRGNINKTPSIGLTLFSFPWKIYNVSTCDFDSGLTLFIFNGDGTISNTTTSPWLYDSTYGTCQLGRLTRFPRFVDTSHVVDDPTSIAFFFTYITE